jgi:hypothetical protein
MPAIEHTTLSTALKNAEAQDRLQLRRDRRRPSPPLQDEHQPVRCSSVGVNRKIASLTIHLLTYMMY